MLKVMALRRVLGMQGRLGLRRHRHARRRPRGLYGALGGEVATPSRREHFDHVACKKDYGHHNYPLERIEKAITWLKSHGNAKIGIAGASTTGTLALTAASLFDDISLTIAMTPSDFVWQGFMQGKKDG